MNIPVTVPEMAYGSREAVVPSGTTVDIHARSHRAYVPGAGYNGASPLEVHSMNAKVLVLKAKGHSWHMNGNSYYEPPALLVYRINKMTIDSETGYDTYDVTPIVEIPLNRKRS